MGIIAIFEQYIKETLRYIRARIYPSDLFLRTLDATPTLTVSQDSRTLTLDDKNLQIFNELRVKLQDILMAVKSIVAARKKGRSRTADRMGGE
jgi:hypothetical protein